jgi:hypothetical protein
MMVTQVGCLSPWIMLRWERVPEHEGRWTPFVVACQFVVYHTACRDTLRDYGRIIPARRVWAAAKRVSGRGRTG